MAGWESVDDAVPSDANQFGGQYLNRLTQLLNGGNIATVDATLKPLIGTDWKFKYGNLYLNDANNDHTIQILVENQTINTTVKIPLQSYTPDYVVLRKEAEELENKVIDYNKNTFPNFPISSAGTGGLATFTGDGTTKVFDIAHNLGIAPLAVNVNPVSSAALGNFTVRVDSTNIIVTYVVAPPSGAAGNVQLYWNANRGSLVYGTSITQANTWTGAQTFQDQQFKLRNPANTYSLKFRNPVITADYDFQLNSPYDFFIFIDADDSNKIKAKSGRTGAIFSTHATNADVVLKACHDNLTNGGTIFIGPGTFPIYAKLVWTNSVSLIGSGKGKTTLQRNVVNPATNITYDVQADNISIAHLTIDGNYPTSSSSPGTEFHSIGSGILIYDVQCIRWPGSSAFTNRGVMRIENCIMTGINPPVTLDPGGGPPWYSGYGIIGLLHADQRFLLTIIKDCEIQYASINAIWGDGITLIDGCYLANNCVPSGGQVGVNANATFSIMRNCIVDRGLSNDSGMETATGAWIVENNVFMNQHYWGIVIDGNAWPSTGPTIIRGNLVKNCGQSGITVRTPTSGNGFQNFIIDGNICYDDQGSPTQHYGINVSTDAYASGIANHYTITKNICFGNTSGQILDLGNGTDKIIKDNIGYLLQNKGLAIPARMYGGRTGFNNGSGIASCGYGLLVTPTVGNGTGQTQAANSNTTDGNIGTYTTGTNNTKARVGWWGNSFAMRKLNPIFTVRFRLAQNNSGSTGIFYLGFINVAAQPAAATSMLDTMLDTKQGVLFGFRSSDTSNFMIMSNNAQATATYTSTGKTIDTNAHTVMIQLTESPAQINWWYDGVAQTSITDTTNNVPATGTLLNQPFILEAQTATSIQMFEHWSHLSQDWL